MDERHALVAAIRDAIIGRDRLLAGPFGPRLVTYADYTASGRSLEFVEEFLREHVMPTYANTHTESSGTGLQTTRFREDAREIIHRAVGGSEEDVVIFAGSGATGAIHKLIEILNLRIPADLDDRYRLRDRIPPPERPVVLVGPYEHHSNELPWRESIAEVVEIREDDRGQPDPSHLREQLERFADRPLRIGSFSAASNVTGIATDTSALSILLHQHGALAFFDYAAAAPYGPIEMNRQHAHPLDYEDAVFLSPHKLVGGPGTPGVLVVKRKLLTNRVPSVPGGGTVAYVGPSEHRYLTDPVLREEGGTPDILGAVRAGLVFQLKEAVGAQWIHDQELRLVRRALDRWGRVPELKILGNLQAERLSIVSFLVRRGERYLHHNFVIALLNDLFGIQGRGGCSCAGPYGHRLLGIDLPHSREYEQLILQGCEGFKPGWSRVNFNYFLSESEVEFLLAAVEFVARRGHDFLRLYRFDVRTGLWRHRDAGDANPARLHEVTYRRGRLTFPRQPATGQEAEVDRYLRDAEQLAETVASSPRPPAPDDPCFSAEFERLRWFLLPHEEA